MPINITMPALSPTMEEGTLAKWLVKPGDTVEAGDVIAEIETDKATMEVETVDEGVIVSILVEAGTEGVAVNAVIAVMAEEGEDVSAVAATEPTAPAKAGVSETKSPEPVAGDPGVHRDKRINEVASTPVSLQDLGAGDDRIKASPLARRIAALKGIDLAGLKGSGPHGRIIKKDVEGGAAPTIARSGAPASPDGLILPQILEERVYDPASYELVP
ncbi:MAG: E3 binding domain-containing protein, partial [Henriciella sp.]|nr:E3 binding domain-containing protein [Henriciella sp.]